MKKNLLLAVRLCLRFGIISGLVIWVKFLSGNMDKIKLRSIKYPFALRKNTTDFEVFRQVFSEYTGISYPQNAQVIIDGGANIGLFSVFMKNKYPDAKIICVEPDVENFKILQSNTGCYDNVYCENCGIWDKNTKLNVYDKFNLGKWGIICEESPEGKISSVSIDFLLEKYNVKQVDILKLDIEGSEKQVFAGDCEKWLPKIKTIIIETHDRMVANCSKTFFQAINKHFSKYNLSLSGENMIIYNREEKVGEPPMSV
jgi:FkbM family methyltransferase